MAIQQITAAQIAGGVGGGTPLQVETKYISLAAGSAEKITSAFGFVVGLVFIEVGFTDNVNFVDVHTTAWVNMRSFSGVDTANVTDRVAHGVNGAANHTKFNVNRTSSGTVIGVERPFVGTEEPIDESGGIFSYSGVDWPTGGLRITAFEDLQ